MHFSVMVTGEDVEKQLAPFQETNMGPIASEYMERVDRTDEVEDLFQSRQWCFRLTDGRYVDFNQAHHLDSSGKPVLIPGTVSVELSAAEARNLGLGYDSLDDAAADLGAIRDGSRFFTEDNPNSRWDWWEIGGRWGSSLKLLPGRKGYTARPLEFDPKFAEFLNRPSTELWTPKPGFCDQARKCDVDWVGMTVTAGAKAGELWDLVQSWTCGERWSTWAELCGRLDRTEARHQYESQAAIKAIREGQRKLPPEQKHWMIEDAWMSPRQEYVAVAEANAGVTYAAVVEGRWLESDEEGDMPGLEWPKRFRAVLDQLAGTTLVTIVDCHV